MRDTTDNTIEINISSNEARKVSYLLNNEQPVRCTIIGNQPLFYMDYESEIEDCDEYAMDDPFGFEAIEASVARLNEKLKPDFIDSPEHDRMVEERFGEFLEAATQVSSKIETDDQSSSELNKYEFMKADLLSTLNKSRVTKEYLAHGKSFDMDIIYTVQIETAVYDKVSGHIYINPTLEKTDQILLTLRELRRMWQHRNGVLLHPLTFHPDQAILVNRVQIADLAVSVIRGAWELQLSDEKDAWNRLENSSMADLARAFARESFMDFRTLNNGVAASAVFEAWFLSDRCREVDRELIQQMLADYQGYVFENEQTSAQIGADLIVSLGKMPFGKNYLASHINTVMHDALFTEVRDRSNGNFLWFIKFERSFRETEQELQNGESNKSRENLFGNNQKENRFGDHEEENIVSLPHSKARNPSVADEKSSANIIDFHRKSSER